MRASTVVIIGGATVLTLAGCVRAASPEVDVPQSKAEQVVMLLKSDGMTVDPATAEDLSESICGALDAGISTYDVIQVGESSGLTQEEAIATVAAAIVVYCPEYQ